MLFNLHIFQMVKLGSSAGVGAGVDLKDSAEVTEYIENLGIEYRFGCYHEKDPKACHLLGDYWEAVKKDFSKALKIYSSNCDDYGHGHSCHKVGGYKYVGKVCAKDADQAYDYFKKVNSTASVTLACHDTSTLLQGCNLGYSSSCLSAGLLDSAKQNKNYTRSVAPNPALAMGYYK